MPGGHWDVKITVLRRLLVEEPTPDCRVGEWQACTKFVDGQEFVVNASDLEAPEGFCSWAWADIHKYVLTLARGGNFLGSKPGTTVACCTDGYRPVVFRLERVEPPEAE